MSRSPVEDLTGRKYSPPQITQFNVFLHNRVGVLGELLDLLDEQSVRVCAVSVLDATDYAVVRLVTSNAVLTQRTLAQRGTAFTHTQVLGVELCEGQTLGRVCRLLVGAELNLRYAYPLMVRPRDEAIVAVHTDDQTLAGQLLARKHFRLIDEDDLCGL